MNRVERAYCEFLYIPSLRCLFDEYLEISNITIEDFCKDVGKEVDYIESLFKITDRVPFELIRLFNEHSGGREGIRFLYNYFSSYKRDIEIKKEFERYITWNYADFYTQHLRLMSMYHNNLNNPKKASSILLESLYSLSIAIDLLRNKDDSRYENDLNKLRQVYKITWSIHEGTF